MAQVQVVITSVTSGAICAAEGEPPTKVVGDLLHRGPAYTLMVANVYDQALELEAFDDV